ncbi:MAG: hypothetical protein AAB353_13440 [Candidatus Hydrogenedentota bacterium]
MSHAPVELLRLSEAARHVPTRPNVATLWRWARKGVKARNGERIRLAHRRIGGVIYVEPSALDEFFSALTSADVQHFERRDEPAKLPRERTDTQRAKAVEKARTRLKALVG